MVLYQRKRIIWLLFVCPFVPPSVSPSNQLLAVLFFQHGLKHFDEKSYNKTFCDIWKYCHSVNTSPLVLTPPLSFEAMCCFICDRRRVAAVRYLMICLVHDINLKEDFNILHVPTEIKVSHIRQSFTRKYFIWVKCFTSKSINLYVRVMTFRNMLEAVGDMHFSAILLKCSIILHLVD